MEVQPPVTLKPYLDAATVALHTPYPALIEALHTAFVDPPHCPAARKSRSARRRRVRRGTSS
ncbi:hypothetical protein [Sphingomonas bacterium]|uniref:hypothetical protein n=1 Tax=Sphingomonas bacterium TaxID=1895847 RepID=UPI001575521E|nr:hypothetical protein [Sphingomonas bacterium]